MRYSIFLVFIVLLSSCSKWQDKPATNDPRLTNPYCNDPQAVNYNWGFPGKPDNTTCYYPTDLFKGGYSFTDSVYLPDDSLALVNAYSLYVTPLNHTAMSVSGFCGGNVILKFTAGKYGTATVDTNATVQAGQYLCRELDTVSGTFTTTNNGLYVSFKVVSDTGFTSHRGTAKKL